MTVRQLIEQRIKEQDADSNFREVAGAANLKSIMEGRVSAPGYYVFRLRNRAGKNSLVNGVSQRVQESYAVVVVTDNRRGKGSDSSDDNEALCDQVNNALLGWQPDGQSEPMEYSGGQLVTIKDDHYYWQDVYTTARLRRKV